MNPICNCKINGRHPVNVRGNTPEEAKRFYLYCLGVDFQAKPDDVITCELVSPQVEQ